MTHLHVDKLLQKGIEQIQSVGITPGKINPIVIINTRAVNRFGLCRKTKENNYDYQIEIGERMLNADKAHLMNVIVHEILHTCKGCLNHGKTWKQYANIMNNKFGYNISRTTSYEKLNLEKPDYKYIVECQSCGIEIGRRQKSKLITQTHLYRCKCNGKLILK